MFSAIIFDLQHFVCVYFSFTKKKVVRSNKLYLLKNLECNKLKKY
jgi:hypothetical protein